MKVLYDTMTIYYRLETGTIKEIHSGSCDMSVFGEEKSDYEKIWGCVVVDYDEYVRLNPSQFLIDLNKKDIVYTQSTSINKYRSL